MASSLVYSLWKILLATDCLTCWILKIPCNWLMTFRHVHISHDIFKYSKQKDFRVKSLA